MSTEENSEPVRLVGEEGVSSYDGDYEAVFSSDVVDGEIKFLMEKRPVRSIAKKVGAKNFSPVFFKLRPCTPEDNQKILAEDEEIGKTVHRPQVLNHPVEDTAKMKDVLDKWLTVCNTSPYDELQDVCQLLNEKLGKDCQVDFDDKGRLSIRTNLYANQLRMISRSLRAAFPEGGVDEALRDLILKNLNGII